MSRRGTEIYSIFGQIEEVAATIMLEKGEVAKIEFRDIPHTVAFNRLGSPAKFAIIVPREKVARFNTLVEELRA